MIPWIEAASDARLAVFLAGLVLPLAFEPAGLWPVAVLCVAWLFRCWSDSNPGKAALDGWLFAFGSLLSGTYWIETGIHQLAHLDHPRSCLLFLLFIAFVSLCHALCGALCALTSRNVQPGARYVCLLPVLYTLTEMARGHILNGFPWLQLGDSQTDSPLAGFAPIGGVYLESLLVCVSAGLLFLLAQRAGRTRVAIAGALALIWGTGFVLTGIRWTHPGGCTLRVSLVQANYPLEKRWHIRAPMDLIHNYAGLSQDLLLSSDLVVWPEGAIIRFPGYRQSIRRLLEDREGARLLYGSVSRKPDGMYNSAELRGADAGRYNKRKLVPFFEFMPADPIVRPLLARFGFDPPASRLSEGTSPAEMYIAGLSAGISICYDDAYTSIIRDAAAGATMLLNLSNDGWFGRTPGPYQHLQIARQRALETGRYMVRATNTGISAFIGPDGKVREETHMFETAIMSVTVPAMSGDTPYVRLGYIPVLLSLSLLLASVAVRARNFFVTAR